jgi:acetyltransferase-like isoleucine patch superfamily enzyme
VPERFETSALKKPSLWHRLALRLKLWRSATVGRDLRMIGKIFIRADGKIVIGDRVTLDASVCPLELNVLPGAQLIIGDDVVISGGCSIEAAQLITIGNNTRIAPFCKVIDTNWHPLRYEGSERDPTLRPPPPSPVHIENNVSLEANVIVLPGVKIGDGTRVLERSVVSRSLPPNVTVEGFPTRPAKQYKATAHASLTPTRP